MLADVASEDVVWQPFPGTSQELAIDSRADHTLYHGTRGPGKTATQLMSFRKGVGIGYGAFWRGIIFDREFKNLSDLEAQSKKFFLQFGDGARFLKGAADYKWVWPTGEELLFRHVKKIGDYDNFHGHEYCLAEGQRIHTSKGLVAIQNLSVGDAVLTPQGYRKITRTFSMGIKPCVRVRAYTLDGRLYSEQRHAVTHRLLSSELSWQKFESGRYQKLLLWNGKFPPEGDVCLSRLCAYPKNRDDTEKRGCEGSASKVFHTIPRKEQQDLSYAHQLSGQHEPSPLWANQPHTQTPTRRYGCEGSSLRSLPHRGDQSKLPYGQVLLSERHQQLRNSTSRYDRVQSKYDRVLLHANEGYFDDYSPDHDPYGEPFRKGIGSAQSFPPSQRDAQTPNHLDTSGVAVSESKRNLQRSHVYPHPYTGRPVRSNLPLSEFSCVVEPCSFLPCYDIEVESANNYITEGGFVNKNCFIGWNELTKYPTMELYEKMMSINRSAFIPEIHTPRDPKDHEKYDTEDGKPLPPIPLIVFSTTNPQGPGHHWVKHKFITAAPMGHLVKTETEIFNPRTQKEEIFVKTQIAIFGSYRENPHLPASYVAGLENITDPNLRAAWLNGSWDVNAGGAFDDVWKNDIHIVPRFKIPSSWSLDRSFDWGSSHPFSVGWWAEADGTEATMLDGTTFCPARGSLIQLQEWYGTHAIGTNKGLKLSAKDIADGIRKEELDLMARAWILEQPLPGPADTQISNVREIDVDTIEKKMADRGVRWTKADKSPGSRTNGFQILRDRLEASVHGELPGIYFMANCQGSIITIPALPRDEKNLDDVDTDAEDHPYDMVRYRVAKGSNRMATHIPFRFPT